MSKKEKLEVKIRNNPRNVSLKDFESLICRYGEIKEGGSHPQAIIGNGGNVIQENQSDTVTVCCVSLRFNRRFD